MQPFFSKKKKINRFKLGLSAGAGALVSTCGLTANDMDISFGTSCSSCQGINNQNCFQHGASVYVPADQTSSRDMYFFANTRSQGNAASFELAVQCIQEPSLGGKCCILMHVYVCVCMYVCAHDDCTVLNVCCVHKKCAGAFKAKENDVPHPNLSFLLRLEFAGCSNALPVTCNTVYQGSRMEGLGICGENLGFW